MSKRNQPGFVAKTFVMLSCVVTTSAALAKSAETDSNFVKPNSQASKQPNHQASKQPNSQATKQVRAKPKAIRARALCNYQVVGLKNLDPGIINRLLVNDDNQPLNLVKDSNIVLEKLQDSGWFETAELLRDNKTGALVIKVIERPLIANLQLKGVSAKQTEVKALLAKYDVYTGSIYNPVALKKFAEAVRYHYIGKGNYGAKVTEKVTSKAGASNSLNLLIDVYEGPIAQLKHIKIIGNNNFKTKDLTQYIKLTDKSGFWAKLFDFKKNLYLKERLAEGLDNLKNFYFDRGYLDFNIKSQVVSLSLDKKAVSLTLTVEEGQQYRLGTVKVALDLAHPDTEPGLSWETLAMTEAELQQLAETLIKPGDIFARNLVIETQDLLKAKFGDLGYARAELMLSTSKVEPSVMNSKADPSVMNAKAELAVMNLNFTITPKRKFLVRRINISGNELTQDQVLRRAIPQLEASQVSTVALDHGKDNLLYYGYANSAEINLIDVPGKIDQLDVDYKIKEQRLMNISAGISYSNLEKLGFNLGANMPNFMGTGNDGSFTFNRSKVSSTYDLSYYNPYYTPTGIGRGFNAFYNRTNLSKSINIFQYAHSSFGGDLFYTFPVAPYQRIKTSLGLLNDRLSISGDSRPEEILRFTNKHGLNYTQYLLGLSWNFNKLNRPLFPTTGFSHEVSTHFAMPGSKILWYQTGYRFNWFKPLNKAKDYIFSLGTNISYAGGYGSKIYPFFKHYYAGGADTVRGYEDSSLGPKDSFGNDFGGNFLINARMSVIVPTPFVKDQDSMRTSFFIDAGQVYDTLYKTRLNGVKRNDNHIRYAVGVAWQWHLPVLGAPISFSLAKPIKKYKHDQVETFAFNVGTNLL